ncbi:hypothetical protein TNCV_1993281 [Trichonephila clavipes]|nr:hypothetical protein TNCV_1993281 [Trichonephila clavipes]
MENLEVKKGELYLRESEEAFQSAIPGSSRINESEDGLKTEKCRVSNSTVDIEPASSHKLCVELQKSEDFPQ